MYIRGTRASSFQQHVIITGVVPTDTSVTAHLTKEGLHGSGEYTGVITMVKTKSTGRVYVLLISPLPAKRISFRAITVTHLNHGSLDKNVRIGSPGADNATSHYNGSARESILVP